jgi:inhibitor of KinA
VNRAAVSTKPLDRRIQPYGETGLLVQFDETDAVAATNAVTALNQQLLDLKVRGIESTTPSYVSLLIIFDPSLMAGNRLASILTDLLECTGVHLASESSALKTTAWRLPTLFVGERDEDAIALKNELGLSWDQVVETFCKVSYRVSALGFLPGFTYLGGLPAELHCRRLATPRVRIPSSSVALAGQQAGIYPMDSPGGWRILGRLPFAIFDQTRESPALFSPNDRITFEPVPESLFGELAQKADKGALNFDSFKQ